MSVTRWLVSPVVGVVFAVLVGGCGQGASPLPMEPDAPRFSSMGSSVQVLSTLNTVAAKKISEKIGETGGTLSIEGGHSISFPAGALPGWTDISMERVEGNHVEVRFGPHGQTFPQGKEPVLTLNWSDVENPDPALLSVAYVDSEGNVLEVLTGTVDTTQKTITVKLSHFSGYAVAH